MMTEYRLDMMPGSVPDIVHISEKDAGSRELAFRLLLQGEAFTVPADADVLIVGRKSDGTTFSEEATASDDLVTIAVTADMSDVAGPAMCRISMTDDDAVINSQLFVLMIESDPIHGISDDDMSTDGVDNQILYLNVGPYVLDGILYNLPNPSVTDEILKGVL